MFSSVPSIFVKNILKVLFLLFSHCSSSFFHVCVCVYVCARTHVCFADNGPYLSSGDFVSFCRTGISFSYICMWVSYSPSVLLLFQLNTMAFSCHPQKFSSIQQQLILQITWFVSCNQLVFDITVLASVNTCANCFFVTSFNVGSLILLFLCCSTSSIMFYFNSFLVRVPDLGIKQFNSYAGFFIFLLLFHSLLK